MELRARFDEDNNIQWAERLEAAGCKVLYGLPGYKVHCKVCLITRRQGGTVKYITQIGTGNYNEKTARLYTDLSLVTASREIGEDAVLLFNNLLMGNLEGRYQRLLVAPRSLKSSLISRVDREIDKARGGRPAHIVIKCNSITDKALIEKLVEASQSGVRVRMIVRGICCLVPRIAGLTENVTVVSIVGQFLEHSRVYCFGEGRDSEMFLSSADLMTRNTADRVEVACPVLNRELRARLREMLEIMLGDNVKAWEHLPDGSYRRRGPSEEGEPALNSQRYFAENARPLLEARRPERKTPPARPDPGPELKSAVRRRSRKTITPQD